MKCKHGDMSFGKKPVALLLALLLLMGGVVGGTLAWLTDTSDTVTNTFSLSTIKITLTEEGATAENENDPLTKDFQMIPGHVISKDPKVTVEAGSEDCWLFVKITESTTPDLDAYISYAIADGWQIVEPKDGNGDPVTSIADADVIVIGRRVYKNDAIKEFGILGKGTYVDPMGTEVQTDDFTISWKDNQVCVNPSVTGDMMTAITGKTLPSLTFTAYASQLYTGAVDDKGDKVEFDAAQAWANAQPTSATVTP